MSEMQTVLVVDDTPENLDLMRAVLSHTYKVKVAINGEAALKLVAASPPDIVLLDVMMPGIDGYEVCRRLKADPTRRHVPVILVSALSETSDDGQGFAVGAVDYISKPVSGPMVLARVRTHLALARLEKAARRALIALEGGGATPAEIAAVLQAALPANKDDAP